MHAEYGLHNTQGGTGWNMDAYIVCRMTCYAIDLAHLLHLSAYVLLADTPSAAHIKLLSPKYSQYIT